ncbi:MAG TPA: MFS transporter [Egibacteraceae bacterium]|nr:MFS transporter [Egibacteraceae bacterium]
MQLLDRRRYASYRSLLSNADFRRWFWSSLGSSLGDWVGLFALQVLIVSLAEPGSRLALFGLGGIMMARLLPSVVFGPVAGVVADRYNRKRLLITCDVARAALFVGIAFSRDVWALFALTVIVESLSLLYLSAKNAVLPAIVDDDDLTEANQLTLLITYGPLPFGAAVAALLSWLSGVLARTDVVQIDGTTGALLLNAATFAIAGLLLVRLRSVGGSRERDEEDADTGAVQQIKDGIAFIRDRQVVRSLILGVIGVFFGAGIIITLGPEFVRSDLGKSESDWYGLMTTVGFGLLLGIAATPVLNQRLSNRTIFPVALIVAALAATGTAVVPSFPVVQAVGFVMGALAGVSFVSGFTLLHETTDDQARGRTFATFFTGTRISMFAALGFGPFLAGAIGRWTVGIGGADVTVSGVRLTIVLGGLVALVSAVVSGRGMLKDR